MSTLDSEGQNQSGRTKLRIGEEWNEKENRKEYIDRDKAETQKTMEKGY
jgi:hypothetical protein